mmetsp:Transcript_4070/g.8194  ORF Transcript_4070/g.8194 Transcript_4070/m.8194 type:complete len:343 (+) Transcript_4070:92-1120(+)
MLLRPLGIVKRVTAPRLLEGGFVVKAGGVVDAVFNVLLEVTNQTLYRPGGRISKGTNGVSFNLTRDFFQHGNLTFIGIALFHANQDVFQPACSFAAWCALSTRFMFVEMRKTANGRHHVHGLVKHGDRSRTKTGSLGAQVIKVHQGFITEGLVQDGNGRTTRDAGLDGVPAIAHTTAVLFDQIPQRNRHGLFHNFGALDMSRNRKELGTAVIFTAKRSKPRGTTTQNCRRDCNGFHIGDRRRTSKDTYAGGEWRLETRLALLTLETLDKSRFFTANVGTSSTVQINIKIISGSAGVLSNQTRAVGFVNGFIHDNRLIKIFSTNVNVGSTSTHGITGQQTSFH